MRFGTGGSAGGAANRAASGSTPSPRCIWRSPKWTVPTCFPHSMRHRRRTSRIPESADFSMRSARIRPTSDSIVDLDRRRRASPSPGHRLRAEPHQHGDQFGDLGVGGQPLPRPDPLGLTCSAPARTSSLLISVDRRQRLLVAGRSACRADAVAADLVERLDQLRPHDGDFGSVPPDPAPEVEPLNDATSRSKASGSSTSSLGLGPRHGLRLLGGPRARQRGLQAEHVADVLALLPGAEHLV